MTRKKSNVKALALAVTCAILAGGGISLESVYAADVLYKEAGGNVTTANKNGETNNTIINELTVGGVKIGSETGFTGISISGSSTTNHVVISDNDILASGSVTAKIITDGEKVRMSDGNVVAKKNLYIGATDIFNPTNENSKFYVNGESGNVVSRGIVYAKGLNVAAGRFTVDGSDGSFKAANEKFNVSNSGAITAESLTLADNYNVKTNIEDAKSRITVAEGKITTVEGNLSTNQANLTALQGRVDGHDTEINTLKTKTQDIKYENDGSTTVDGVNFNGGAVSGVTSINNTHVGGVTLSDGTIEAASGKFKVYDNGAMDASGGAFKVSSAGTIKALGIQTHSNGSITLNDKLFLNAEDASLQDKAAGKAVSVAEMANTRDNTQKISYTANGTKIDSDVIINEGEKNQVKITEEEGIVVGLNSSVINDDGVFAGGHDYENAKAALNANDGSIKGANGDFTVDGTNGNVTTKGDIKGVNITATGALNVAKDATVGGNLGVTGDTTVGGDLTVTKKIKGESLNIGATGSEFTVDTVGHMTSKSAKIGSVGIDNTGAITGVTSLTTNALTVTGAFTTGGNLTVNGDLTANGAINGKTISISDGGSIAGVNFEFETGGKLTAATGTIGGVSFAAGGNVSGITELTATTIKDGAGTIINSGNVESKTAKIGAIKIENETIEGSSANGLSIEGVKIKDGVMSSVVSIDAAKATIGGVNTLDNTGLTVKTGSKVQVGTNTVIEDGSVKVSQKTSLTDQSLQLNDTNKWTQAGGLVADKATVNGIALGTDSKGKATFSDAAGKTTTIDGDTITTGTITADELNVDKISLGKGTDKNITIGSNGDVTTKGDVTVTGADDDTTVIDGAKATFGKDAANQTTIDKGKISAKAKSTTNQIAEFGFDENGLTVSGQNAAGQKSSFSFNAKTGANTFTGQDGTTTTINGSAITSTKATGDTGVLDGSNLTLKKGVNSTVMTAGGVTFTGKQGASTQHGDTTTIDGGIITTDTLKVQRIQLGEKIVDQRTGETIGSGVTLASDGGFTAAGGNFKVTGGTTGSKGSIKNVVGDATNGKTAFETNQQGANMSFEKGGIKSEVAVADDSAKISAGASSIEVKNDGITNNGVTTFNGTTGTTTKIDGGTITTNHLITDKLTITGSGNADGTGSTTGSIAFGGNGSITSNIKDAATGKEATFKTDEKGTFTEAKDNDGNKTTNTVNAKGNTNVVTDSTNTSTATQTATSIGGVVTNGTVTMRQELTADGVKVSVDGDTANYTQITNKDVSITDQKNPGKRINLSDLGQLNNLDGELAARDEYQDNKTAVGAINAEAGIRREEVTRLDGRINDVNDRVNKVGAMAAAIASLKSIGYDPQAPSEFSIGLGQYKGETGVAMGFFHYPNKNFMINVSLSTAGGETMGGIGATWRFGHKSPQKLLEEQREAQAKKELAAAEKYQAAAKLAKEAQERAEYAAKLARQAQVSADNAKAAADATQAKHFG